VSTLWTPSGERRVPPPSAARGSEPPSSHPSSHPPSQPNDEAEEGAELDEAELREQMEQLREQLAETPAEVVVANHGFGLFELAALHLSLQPPQLPQAQLAIDALGALVEGMAGRLGEQETTLRDGLTQLRLAFVQIQGAAGAAPS
jgi:hypothetical protein